jgi:RNA polymerase sigma-70 factor (ECF subfamily)
MEDAIENAYFAGQREWAGLARGTLQDYTRHVRALGTCEGDLERHGADLYLALACGLADPEALRILARSFFPPLDEHLARSGFDGAARQDVFQQMLLHLCAGECPRILTYAGRAALSSWLRVTTMRFALNMQCPAARGGQRTSDVGLELLLGEGADPERQMAVEKARPLFQTALQAAIGNLADRDRTLLRLCFLDGLTIETIGNMYGVHRATAARWIADIRHRILKDVQSLLVRDSALHASEFGSLACLVRSELHLSLRRVLGTS